MMQMSWSSHQQCYSGNVGIAGVRPGRRATFVPAKVAKTLDAPSGLIGWDGRKL